MLLDRGDAMQIRIFIAPGISGRKADAFFLIQSMTIQASVSQVYIPAIVRSSSTGIVCAVHQIRFAGTDKASLVLLVIPGMPTSCTSSVGRDMPGSM